ncbi:hypothetical protein GPL17_18700 [Bradyrhizobium yuanmingense]|uniref:hypothetical protein n=1 Tax=Bradyrhizobium yuanmingense TaxID=108015 RepID=UPI0012FBFC10|nr:hypothetical protein [Bradyrhizobium yuanmingense]MVT52514.1 hypothetical protein [Bradyrhizobium yuanmingense]
MNMMVSATAIAAASPALAVVEGDSDILDAVTRLHGLKAVYDEAQARWDEVYAQFSQRRPEKPAAMEWRPCDSLNVSHYGKKKSYYCPFDLNKKRRVQQLTWTFIGPDHCMPAGAWDDENARPKAEYVHLFTSHPDERRQKRLDEAVAALDVYTAQVDSIQSQIGFREVEDRLNDIYFNQVLPLQELVIKTPARTAAGVRAKARMAVEWFFEETSEGEYAEMTDYDRLISDIVNGLAEIG